MYSCFYRQSRAFSLHMSGQRNAVGYLYIIKIKLLFIKIIYIINILLDWTMHHHFWDTEIFTLNILAWIYFLCAGIARHTICPLHACLLVSTLFLDDYWCVRKRCLVNVVWRLWKTARYNFTHQHITLTHHVSFNTLSRFMLKPDTQMRLSFAQTKKELHIQHKQPATGLSWNLS